MFLMTDKIPRNIGTDKSSRKKTFYQEFGVNKIYNKEYLIIKNVITIFTLTYLFVINHDINSVNTLQIDV